MIPKQLFYSQSNNKVIKKKNVTTKVSMLNQESHLVVREADEENEIEMSRECKRQYTDECAPVTVEDFNGLDTSHNS